MIDCTALDAGFFTGLLLLDLNAAFECVDQAILMQILQHQFGITSTPVLLWIASFLSNRSHKVRKHGSQTSRTYNILFGLPQWSILGSLLFVLYTSSITNIAHSHGITIHLYADDTQPYIKLSTTVIINAKSRLIDCIHEIQTWSASMLRKLNASKTKLIWFDRKPSCNKDSPSKIMNIEANNVPSKKVVRNLGVLINYQLTYHQPATSISAESARWGIASMNIVLKS